MSNRKKVKKPPLEGVSEEDSARLFRESREHMKRTGGQIAPLPPDPWTWNIQTADDYLNLHILSSNETPSFAAQYAAVMTVNRLKGRIEANSEGAGFDVLHCVRLCGTNNLVMPEWLAYAFNARYDAVMNFRAISWDDEKSFGKPYPKGTNQAAKRKKRSKMPAIYVAVCRALDEGQSITKALFEGIGKKHLLGVTLTEEYYYSAINDYHYPDPVANRESQIKSVIGSMMAGLDQGKSTMPLGAGGMVKISGMPAMNSREFVKNRGITKDTKKSSIKSSVTSKDDDEPKRTKQASKPKRAAAKTPTGRSPRRAS